MIVDDRKRQRGDQAPVHINRTEVESVYGFKYLSVASNGPFTLTLTQWRTAWKHLYLWKVQIGHEGAVSGRITDQTARCSAGDRRDLPGVIIGVITSLHRTFIYVKRCLRRRTAVSHT